MNNDTFELVEPSAMEVMQRSEIDVQITTAKRYPRSIELFKKRAISMATLDEETAESCLYRRPVGKQNGQQVFAEGMSVRMAEIVGASYGNLRVYATIIEQTDRQVKARGMAIDLESNFASSSEVVESTVRRDGTPYDERMRVVIAKSALAKARRDATFQVVPKALARPVEEAVRKILVGDAQTLEKRRKAVASWISKCGVEASRVYAALGVKGEADLTAEHLEKLTGLRTAIKDGDTTLDEAFPYPDSVAVNNKPKDETAEAAAGLAPQQPVTGSSHASTTTKAATPQAELEELVLLNGYNFQDFIKWGGSSGNIEDPSSIGSFQDIKTADASRWLRAKAGLLKGLATEKGAV
jgi:hypothetical protein